MTLRIRNSRVLGSIESFYGNVDVYNTVEGISSLLTHCPYSFPDPNSIIHFGYGNSALDNTKKLVKFNQDYSVFEITVGVGESGLQNRIHFGDKNYYITKDIIIDLPNNNVSANLITDIDDAEILLNNGKLLCWERVGYYQEWMEADPFTGTKYSASGALQSNLNTIQFTRYFEAEDIAYVLANTNIRQSYEIVYSLENSFTRTVWNKGGTYDNYFAIGFYFGLTCYWGYVTNANPRYYWIFLQDPFDENIYYYYSSLINYTVVGELIGSNRTLIVRSGANNDLYTLDFTDTIGVLTLLKESDGGNCINFDNRTLYRESSDNTLYDLTNNVTVKTNYPALDTPIADIKNNWIWSIVGTDFCAYNMNGVLVYTIEDVVTAIGITPYVIGYRNKFIFHDKIVHWEWED